MLGKLAAALVFAIGVAALALADAPFVRHGSVILHGPRVCFASQFENLPEHMDLVVLGSSRMWAGIDPETVTAASNNQLSSVYNLATPGVQAARSAVVFDELLAAGKKVDVLVVEADIDTMRRGRMMPWNWHQAVAGRATWGEIFTLTPRLAADDTAQDPRVVSRALLGKLRQAILIVTSGLAWDVASATDAPASPVCKGDPFFPETPEAAMRQYGYGQAAVRRFGDVSIAYDRIFSQRQGPRARGELQLFEHIRQRARAAGTRVIFVRPQAYGQPALHPRVIAQLQHRMPEFAHPPEALARRLNFLVFDGTHYGREGRVLYSQWIANVALGRSTSPPAEPAPAAPSN